MNWNSTEFKTYVLLEAAYGDMDFSAEEKDLIQSRISSETYQKMTVEYMNDTDYERIQKISDAAKFHCDTNDKRQALFEKVRTLFESDGKFDQMEKNLMMFLEKMI